MWQRHYDIVLAEKMLLLHKRLILWFLDKYVCWFMQTIELDPGILLGFEGFVRYLLAFT